MSLDFHLYAEADVGREEPYRVDLCDFNITNNLGAMALEADIYECLWHPRKCGIVYAEQLTEHLQKAVADMEAHPEKYRRHNAPTGWGTYEQFVPWVRAVLEACERYPKAKVRACI